jgi:hypothetical protein
MIKISNDTALLELSNKTNKPIYLAHSPSDINNSKNGFVFYNLDCKEKSGKESKDYGINTHGVPILDALEQDKSIRFEVSQLPKTEAICTISVMYYENKNIADLINNKNPYLSESESELVERSKRFVELTFDSIKN